MSAYTHEHLSTSPSFFRIELCVRWYKSHHTNTWTKNACRYACEKFGPLWTWMCMSTFVCISSKSSQMPFWILPKMRFKSELHIQTNIQTCTQAYAYTCVHGVHVVSCAFVMLLSCGSVIVYAYVRRVHACPTHTCIAVCAGSGRKCKRVLFFSFLPLVILRSCIVHS